jgi:sialate O-acetylesterase
MRVVSFVILILFLSTVVAIAQLSLPRIFSDHMVLQRGIDIPIWGTAPTGIRITAELAGVRVTTVTKESGKWMIRLPSLQAGGPYQLFIYSENNPNPVVQYSDVLIGDVWVASGQSNMEWQVQQSQDAKKEISAAKFSNIRFLFIEHDKKLTPQNNVLPTAWKVCDTTNVKQFSAVAYYFSRKIHQDQNVPIGIIQSAWGGTPVEPWTSKEMLYSSPITRPAVLATDTLAKKHFVTDSLDLIRFWEIVLRQRNNLDNIIPSSDYNDADWAQVEMPRLIKDFGSGSYEGIVWLRKKILLTEAFNGKDLTINLGHPEMNYSLYFNGTEICKNVWNANATHYYTIPAHLVKNGENIISIRMAMLWGGGGLNPPNDEIYITNNSSKISLTGKWLYKKDLEPKLPQIKNYHYYPAVLFNAMINPLIPYGIKGFLWYQGEANVTEAYNYRTLFPMLISDWRQRWNQGNLPFLYVQLANFKKTKADPSESDWAELREAQTLTLSFPNTGMACIIDIGDADNIHPSNKQEVGRRLALIANKLVYNQHEIVASGPLYKNYKINGSRIRMSFTNTGSKLTTKDDKQVTGFAIAGDDKKFYWAKAVIEGNDVVVYSDKVSKPKAVRYAWADNPECNLINSEGLPAIPFRTDDWKDASRNNSKTKQ